MLNYVLIAALAAFVSTKAEAATWGDFTMMFSKSAGTFGGSCMGCGEWAWSPQSAIESFGQWGTQGKWSDVPEDLEAFVVNDRTNFVMQRGWWQNGVWYPVQETSAFLGDVACNNLQPLKLDPNRWVHYAIWTIPAESYCLKITGNVIGPGWTVRFGWTAVWTPPATCSNQTYSRRSCIGLWEAWYDDGAKSSGPLIDRLERQSYIAEGLGMAFKMITYYPTPVWSTYGNAYWKYQ